MRSVGDNKAMNCNLSVKSRIFSREKNCFLDTEANLLQEKTVSIFISEKLVMKIVCTENFMKELVVGRLITEGLIQTPSEIETIFIDDEKVKVILSDSSEDEIQISETDNILSCCPNNKTFLLKKDLHTELASFKATWSPLLCEGADSTSTEGFRNGFGMTKVINYSELSEKIFLLAENFQKDTKLHKETSGTHSCYVFAENQILFSAEDIGRHNAMDKAIGWIYMNGINPAETILFTTGRVPVDMVEKAIRGKIPVLVSKSVPTVQAVELAKKNGILLVCKAWPDSFTVYE